MSERPRFQVNRETRPMYQREFAAKIADYWSQLPETSGIPGAPIEDVGDAAGRVFRSMVESGHYTWLGVYAFRGQNRRSYCLFHVINSSDKKNRRDVLSINDMDAFVEFTFAVRSRTFVNRYHLRGVSVDAAPEVARRSIAQEFELKDTSEIQTLWESEIGR